MKAGSRAPIRDAVGLINAQKCGPRASEQGSDCGGLERLGRRENDEAATLLEPFKRSAPLSGSQPAVKRDHGNTALL
jgi:hypothetical protein